MSGCCWIEKCTAPGCMSLVPVWRFLPRFGVLAGEGSARRETLEESFCFGTGLEKGFGGFLSFNYPVL